MTRGVIQHIGSEDQGMSHSHVQTTSRTGSVGLILGGSLLMALSARISIDIGPVPFTAQPLALAVVVALLGWRRSSLAMIAYLIEGASGLPVFAGGAAGPAVLAGPTAGYLWSYPVAAAVIGRLYSLGFARTYVMRWTSVAAGIAIVYGSGFVVLSLFVGPTAALTAGIVPFIIPDLVKISIAAAVRPSTGATQR